MNKFLVILFICFAVPSWSQEDRAKYLDSIARANIQVFIAPDSILYIAYPYFPSGSALEEINVIDSIARANTHKLIEDYKQCQCWFCRFLSFLNKIF